MKDETIKDRLIEDLFHALNDEMQSCFSICDRYEISDEHIEILERCNLLGYGRGIKRFVRIQNSEGYEYNDENLQHRS